MKPRGERRSLVARQGSRPVKRACGPSRWGWRALTRDLALEAVALCILTGGCILQPIGPHPTLGYHPATSHPLARAGAHAARSYGVRRPPRHPGSLHADREPDDDRHPAGWKSGVRQGICGSSGFRVGAPVEDLESCAWAKRVRGVRILSTLASLADSEDLKIFIDFNHLSATARLLATPLPMRPSFTRSGRCPGLGALSAGTNVVVRLSPAVYPLDSRKSRICNRLV
jgi:hypothetical protein